MPDELAVADQPLDAGQDQLRGRVLGHVVVGPGLQPGEHVGVVMPHGEHQHRDARRRAVGAESPADLEAVEVGEVHVKDDDVRPSLLGLRDRLGSA